jgi:hypothetical protein
MTIGNRYSEDVPLTSAVAAALAEAKDKGVTLEQGAHELGAALITQGWGYSGGPGIAAVLVLGESEEEHLAEVARAVKDARGRGRFNRTMATVG